MLCFPNCKINLGLYITRRRDDGYHDIETIFYPLKLNDVLEVVPSAATNLHQSGKGIAGSLTDNLVWKAYKLLYDDYPHKVPSVDIYLHKIVPMGAGLGGGSADGAYMLRLLNDYCNLGLSIKQLISYALRLGSDCPFFIVNTPQFATGRGEIMQDISLNLSEYSIQLICPHLHVSTRAAFGIITSRPPSFDLTTLANFPIEQWQNLISNDFEPPVFAQHPILANIKRQLYEQGALYAAMSGSGSSIFGIFKKQQQAVVKTDIPFEVYYLG